MEEVKPQLPVESPEPELLAPSFGEKLKANKGKIIGGILGILVFAGVVFGAYKLGQRQIQPSQPTPTPEAVVTPTPDPTADWETYTNDFAKFSLKYPPSMTVTEKVFSAEEKQIIFTGPKGTITINAAVPESSGWGGGCDPEQKGEVEFLGNPTQACLTEEWLSQLYGQHPDGHSQVQISANFASPFSQNKEIILRALSTFRFLEEENFESRKASLLNAINAYLEALIIDKDWEEAKSYLSTSAYDLYKGVDGPTQYAIYEILNEYHSVEEEASFYNQPEPTFNVKFYKESDSIGTRESIKFFQENGEWKTDAWFGKEE